MATVDTAAKTKAWSELQTKYRDIQNQAGSKADVKIDQIKDFQEDVQKYVTTYGDDSGNKATIDKLLGKDNVGSLGAIIVEGRTDKANDIKWQQASSEVGELLRTMAPTTAGTNNANVALKDDFDSTLGGGLEKNADASTAKKLQNFIDAHPGLSKDFLASANAMMTKLKADPTKVSGNEVRELGLAVTGSNNKTAATGGTGGTSGTATGNTPASSTSLPAGITANVPVSAADKAKLPGLLKDTTNQVMALDTVPPTYMEMDNNTYALYDNTGNTRMQEFGKDKDFALGLGNNKWFVSNDNDLSKAKFIKEPAEDPKAATRNAYTFSNASNAKSGAVTDTKGTLANYGKTTGDAATNASSPPTAGMTVVADPKTLPGNLKDVKTPVIALETTPASYVRKDGDVYCLYGSDGKAKQNNIPLGNGDMIALNGGKYLKLDASGDVAKAKVYNSQKDIPAGEKKALWNPNTSPSNLDWPTPLSSDAHSAKDNDNNSKPPVDSNRRPKFWAGAESPQGGTVFVDITTPYKDGTNGTGRENNDHTAKLKDESGNDITPSELNAGQFGTFTFTNKAQYIASNLGYFIVSDGQAKNIVTGELITDKAKVDAVVASYSGTNKQTQKAKQ